MKKNICFFLFLVINILSFSQISENLDSCCYDNIVPYYYKDAPLQYIGGFYALKEFVIEKYNTKKYQKIQDNTGIVVIHFKITCNGIVKNINSESYNYDYKIININPIIIETLQNIVSDLNEWEIGINQRNELLCYHKFLTFKLLNGQIIEILPK
jgi:hypothetical protein